jgi:hypothetical protein
MKNNKYQITGIKGRLLYLSFVLLIVLLYACDGGYEPSVRNESISFEYTPKTADDPTSTSTLKITVYIPSKIKDTDLYGVDLEPATGLTLKLPVSPTPQPIGTPPLYGILETTTFTYIVPEADFTITITVTKLAFDEGSSRPNEDSETVAKVKYTFTFDTKTGTVSNLSFTEPESSVTVDD